MKKSLIVSAAAVLVLGVITAAAVPVRYSHGFTYKSSDLGGAMITDYKGKSEKLEIPEKLGFKNVTEIGSQAFAYSEVESVIVPDGMKTIGHNAFIECHDLKSIQIPNSVTKIGSMAFYGCFGLKNTEIPDSVTELSPAAFGFSGLESVKLPANIKVLENSLFIYCKNLKSIEIPDGVWKIDRFAFNFCESLAEVKLPDSVTVIEDAFQGCDSLTELVLPDGMTEISDTAFNGSYNISVTYKGKTYSYDELDALYAGING